MSARIANESDKALYAEYNAFALYSISNNRKVLKSIYEIQKMAAKPKEIRDGKQVAEEAAKRMGVKINWGK